MNTPICRACAKPQHGVVEFRWSEGAVVYECKECGSFNEVSEIVRPARARPARQHHLRVTLTHDPPMRGTLPSTPSKEHVR